MLPKYDELVNLVSFLSHRIDLLEKTDELSLNLREKDIIKFCTENRLNVDNPEFAAQVVVNLFEDYAYDFEIEDFDRVHDVLVENRPA
jgi:hypothetical protein